MIYKYYNFIYISCHNISLFYKFKNLYYDKEKQKLKRGIEFNGVITELYETMIPPMLRFFHIQNISPSGWIELRKFKRSRNKNSKIIELNTSYKNIISLENKENVVPYKICSFDIEASSSHGDFPDPKKNYRKVAYDIVQFMKKEVEDVELHGYNNILKQLLLNVFEFNCDFDIDVCYLVNEYKLEDFNIQFDKFIKYKIALDNEIIIEDNALENYLSISEGVETNNNIIDNDDDDEYRSNKKKIISKNKKSKKIQTSTIVEIFENNEISYEMKGNYLLLALNKHFPKVKSDYVTFIGSTFVTYGEEEPYLNHCICLDDTTNLDETTQTIEC